MHIITYINVFVKFYLFLLLLITAFLVLKNTIKCPLPLLHRRRTIQFTFFRVLLVYGKTCSYCVTVL